VLSVLCDGEILLTVGYMWFAFFQFGRENGKQFVVACCDFCRDQSHAQGVLKALRQKDPRLDSFLQVKSFLSVQFLQHSMGRL